LIFTNALKYNAGGMGLETVSGKAYGAAVFMQNKLEVAVSKLILSSSERAGREFVEIGNAKRIKAEKDKITAELTIRIEAEKKKKRDQMKEKIEMSKAIMKRQQELEFIHDDEEEDMLGEMKESEKREVHIKERQEREYDFSKKLGWTVAVRVVGGARKFDFHGKWKR
jgi:electron transfer flavoprotein alpha subunit